MSFLRTENRKWTFMRTNSLRRKVAEKIKEGFLTVEAVASELGEDVTRVKGAWKRAQEFLTGSEQIDLMAMRDNTPADSYGGEYSRFRTLAEVPAILRKPEDKKSKAKAPKAKVKTSKK